MERIALGDLSDQSRNFTTTIVVLRKQPPKTSRSGTVKMQNLIFEYEGVQMRATIFEQDIDLFRDTLHEGKEYDITNPLVSRMPDYLIKNEQQYQMTIKSTTKVTETQSSIHDQISETSYWVSLDAVNDYIGKSDRIDIVGVAIHVHEIRTVTSQTTGRTYDIRDIQLTDTSVVENTEKIYELKTSMAKLSNENTEQNGHSDVLISLLPEQQVILCILHVDVEDSSGRTPMTLFGHHAEFVLDKKANEISILSMQERRIFIEETVEKLKDKYFNIELTTYMLGDNRQLRWKTKEITYATV
ncbi:uncharacterized protein LOC125498581 [Beta vulgaris subsp. vulgaris]|uniref:uncharacterized protein LOC125498581 n=1 Tax=Beta vulgaris subsp. vulgaris TaxID=3555 RepID=UPI0025468BF4|nr:uncharacterized protein LOC125498581 [Beta vulgaris subsp. vulgaris]